MLAKKINDVKGKIIQFASLIEHMIDKSVRGLIDRNEALIDEVVNGDEPRANSLELEIEEICINLIAQFQPMAKDLRTILVIYNMCNSLERMGDHAVNIAESAAGLVKGKQIKPFIDVPRMNELARRMLNDTITAFMHEDAELAARVCGLDEHLDGLRDQIMRELVTFMTENPQIISGCIQIMRVAENLERIGDLSTNISEDVIFMSRGTVIKHHKAEGTAH